MVLGFFLEVKPIFIDEITIHLRGGRGGDGAISFRREKYEPRGGPDGGDGGDGGSIILSVDPSLNTLSHLQHRKLYRAAPGRRGGAQRSAGRRGEDHTLKVPPGTLVYTEDKKTLLADLHIPGQNWVAARGGRGGRGNAHFKSSTRQAPRYAKEGEKGQEVYLSLELRLLADVGLVGLPNAGKSTLLSQITRARPRIASYPFTTLYPHLGVAQLDMMRTFVVADIPGLIKGAHQGAGLGVGFLRHIERTRLLIHLLDGSGLEGRDPVEDFLAIHEELSSYHPLLAERERVVAVNKIDLLETREGLPRLEEALLPWSYKVFPISAATGEGIEAMTTYIYQRLQEIPKGEPLVEIEEIEHSFEPMREEIHYSIERDEEIFYVKSRQLEEMTQELNPTKEEELLRFSTYLRDLGVEEALRRRGAKHGDLVKLGLLEFTFVE